MTKGFSEEEWRASAEGSPSFHFEKSASERGPSFGPDNSEAEGEIDAGAREWRAAEPAHLRDDQGHQGQGADPRGYNNEARNPDYHKPSAWKAGGDQEDRNWAMIAHGAGAVAAFASAGTLGWATPLAIWLIRKGEGGFASSQAKEALNFQITIGVASIAAVLLVLTVVGIVVAVPMMFIFAIMNVVCSIIGAVKTYNGEEYRYPWNLRLL